MALLPLSPSLLSLNPSRYVNCSGHIRTSSTCAAAAALSSSTPHLSNLCKSNFIFRTLSLNRKNGSLRLKFPKCGSRKWFLPSVFATLSPLDLTEENIHQVLLDARTEFPQIFDASVGITGEAELAEIDGPFVKLALRGRFWHKRSTVLARLGNYLKSRIPEILEVEIEDEKQLDDSPANF